MNACIYPDCGRPKKARGYCAGHALQIKEKRPLAPLKELKRGRGCLFEGCDKKHYARGYCTGHNRQLTSGRPLAPLRELLFRSADEVRHRDSQGRKWCTECAGWWPEDHYSVVRHNKDGLNTRCRECIARYKHAARYNLTPEEFDALRERQGNRCGICECPQPSGRGGWHIDHDHSCCPQGYGACGNCVRGLLCSSCNHLLGNAKDSARTLERAVQYLARHNRKEVAA